MWRPRSSRPGSTATSAERVHEWGTRHQRELVGGVTGIVGIYLVVKGLVGLL